MGDKQKKMYDALCELDGETVTNLFLDWLGAYVLDDKFGEFLEDENIFWKDEEDDEDE